jgi:IS5 family transposase
VRDSQLIEKLLRQAGKGQAIYADSVYGGDKISVILRDRGIESQIIERSFKGKQVTEDPRERNRIKSQIGCRVEHVFGFIIDSMKGFYIMSIGYKRVKGIIGLPNLLYNICRYEQIVRLNLLEVK